MPGSRSIISITRECRPRDRRFSNTAYVPELGVDRTAATSLPANISIPSSLYPNVGTRTPVDPTPNAPNSVLSPVCQPPLSFPTINAPHQCRYDTASRQDIMDPSTRYNAIGRVTWQLRPDLELFGEGAYSRNQFKFVLSETLIAETPTTPKLLLPASSPFYPTPWLQANYPISWANRSRRRIARSSWASPSTSPPPSRTRGRRGRERVGPTLGLRGRIQLQPQQDKPLVYEGLDRSADLLSAIRERRHQSVRVSIRRTSWR